MASSSSSPLLSSLTSTFSSSKPSIPFSFRGFTKRVTNSGQILKAQTLEFSGSFFEGGFGGGNDDEPPTTPWSGISAVEDKEEPQCPPGLRPYETMMVLRPDMSEDERLALTQRYEEVILFVLIIIGTHLGICLLASKPKLNLVDFEFSDLTV